LKFKPADCLQSTKDTWNGLLARQIEAKSAAIESSNAHSKLPRQERTILQRQLLQEKLEASERILDGQGHNMSNQDREGLKFLIDTLRKQILDLQSRLNDG
jgi:hypothetical protein